MRILCPRCKGLAASYPPLDTKWGVLTKVYDAYVFVEGMPEELDAERETVKFVEDPKQYVNTDTSDGWRKFGVTRRGADGVREVHYPVQSRVFIGNYAEPNTSIEILTGSELEEFSNSMHSEADDRELTHSIYVS